MISIPNGDDGDGLDDQMLIRMIIIFTHYPGELGTLRPPCQSIQVHLIKNEREAGMMMPMMIIGTPTCLVFWRAAGRTPKPLLNRVLDKVA